jgi:hypothetical protein
VWKSTDIRVWFPLAASVDAISVPSDSATFSQGTKQSAVSYEPLLSMHAASGVLIGVFMDESLIAGQKKHVCSSYVAVVRR